MSASPPPGGGGDFHLLESPPATDPRAFRSSSAATPSDYDMQAGHTTAARRRVPAV